MFIKCIDNSCETARREGLKQDHIYEINEGRDMEFNIAGERYYFVNGKRYGGWRFEVVSPAAAMLEREGDALERDANRQGASDGRHGYPRNPGDWTGRHLAEYERGYISGRDGFQGVSISELAETSLPWGVNRSPIGPKS